MRRIVSSFVLLLFLSLTAQAQKANFYTIGGNVNQNDTINVDITVKNLLNLYGMEHRHQYDTTVLKYVGLTNLVSELASLSVFHKAKSEYITITWNSSSNNGASFSDSTRIYTLQFVAIGPKGSKSDIKFKPGVNGYVLLDENTDDIPADYNNGVAQINGGGNTNLISVSLTSADGNKNDEVCIDLNVEGFKGVSNFNFAVTWDNAVATYTTAKNYNTNIKGFGSGSINLNGNYLAFAWSHPQGDSSTLTGKQRMVTLCYKLVGNAGDMTSVQVDSITNSNPNISIEFGTPGGDQIPYQLSPGSLKVNSGGGGGTNNFTFQVGKVSIKMGENGCVPITVKNYKDVFGFQFPIIYDDKLITNPVAKNLNSTLSAGGFDSNVLQPGQFFVSHLDDSIKTLPDDAKLFDVCFDAVGDCNSKPSVLIKEIPERGESGKIEAYDEDINILDPIDVIQGEITITCDGGGGGTDSLIILTGTKKVKKGEDVCIPVSVKNFKKVDGLQFVIHWDANILRLKPTNFVQAFNLPRLGAGNFNLENGTDDYLAFAGWTPDNPHTVPDNTTIFEVCFNTIGDCNSSTPVSVVSHGRVTIEALDENGDNIPVATRTGTTTIDCPAPKDISVTIDQVVLPTCHGECDGQIRVVVNPRDSYKYQWYKNDQPISRADGGTGSVLRNVCAGSYFVSIEKVSTGATDSSQTVVINDPPAIDLHKVVTPDMGDCKAKVVVNPTGGYGKYELTWGRTGVRGPVIDNLCKDSMVVLIFKDSVPMLQWDTLTMKFDTVPSINKRFCFFTDTTVVPMKMNSDLAVTGTVKHVTCAGTCDGSIELTVTGASGAVTYQWTGQGIANPSQKDQSGLCAGKYTVNVKDANGGDVTKMFTITQPDSIKITAVKIDSAMNSDGKIDVTVTGGKPPYSYVWKDANGNVVSTSEDLSGVDEGKYTLMVTDDNGCTSTDMFVVPKKSGGGGGGNNKLTVQTSNYQSNYGISCNGDNDGWIKVKGAPQDANFVWSHDATLKDSVAQNLPAGTYNVKVSTQDGTLLLDSTIILSEPTALKARVIGDQCASTDGAQDAQYTVVPSGGTAPYSYQWCDNSTDSIATGLPGGVTCNLIVTDNNDCEYIVNFKVCVQSDTNNLDCYQGRKVITPNNDNLNDYLLITCDNKYDNKLFIYDRWGRLVYEKINYQSTSGDGWRGVDLNGNELNEGGYMWVLRVDLPNGDQRYYKGTVIIAK